MSLYRQTMRFRQIVPRPTSLLPQASRQGTRQARSFQTSAPRCDEVVAPVKKPVGAFRGGIFGFLAGSVTSGALVYYYILNEYRISNELLTEDIYSLQAAVQRMEAYTRGMEDRVLKTEKKP